MNTNNGVKCGDIMMVRNDVAIPPNWILCDGTKGTPDLVERSPVKVNCDGAPAVKCQFIMYVGKSTDSVGTT